YSVACVESDSEVPFTGIHFFLLLRPPPSSTLFPYTTLFRSLGLDHDRLPEPLRHLVAKQPADDVHVPARREAVHELDRAVGVVLDRKSTRLNSSHVATSYAASCLKKNSPDRTPSPPSTARPT